MARLHLSKWDIFFLCWSASVTSWIVFHSAIPPDQNIQAPTLCLLITGTHQFLSKSYPNPMTRATTKKIWGSLYHETINNSCALRQASSMKNLQYCPRAFLPLLQYPLSLFFSSLWKPSPSEVPLNSLLFRVLAHLVRGTTNNFLARQLTNVCVRVTGK